MANNTFGLLTRRSFLASGTAFALGLLFLEPFADAAPAIIKGAKTLGGDATPMLFITVHPDNSIDLVCHRSEMGQQVWTSLAQILVDELEASWDQVHIVQAPGDKIYGDQNTDGSRSIRRNFDRFRLLGAAVRTMLEQAAALQWGVSEGSCKAMSGVVTHAPTGRSLTFGELATAANSLRVPDISKIKLKNRKDWRAISKPIRSLTTPLIIQGQGTYGQDVSLPGMLCAVIAHPPQVFGTVKSFDATRTRSIRGVEQVIELPAPKPPAMFQPLGGIAVLARDTWAAIKGREALDVTWEAGPNAVYNSAEFAEELLQKVRTPGNVRVKRGDVDRAFKTAKTKVAAEYYVPHLAHSAMEPPAVVAVWDGDHVTCWGCIQTPQSARRTVAQICGIAEENVTIEVTWLGGGFGRKSKPDFFAEAALLARQANAPVKVIWTREDDLQHAYYHTVSAQRLEAGLDANGRCTSFLHRTVFPPISSTFNAASEEPGYGDLRQGVTDNPFAIPNFQVETASAKAHIRIGWLRSVANIYHAFAVQSFAAELAHAAGRDQKDYLLELIGKPRHIDPNLDGAEYDNYGSSLKDYPIDTGRMAHTVRRAAELAGWGRELPDGHGLGIAFHRSFASYVATVVEVAVDQDGKLTILGVWSVMDAGTVVNPNHCKNQLEGGTLFGLSNALFGEITVKDGVIEQRNFPEFRVMRINEAPRTMVAEIIESTAAPGGVGEPATPPAAPALANAIFAACGVRVRTLPIFGRDRRDRLPVETP